MNWILNCEKKKKSMNKNKHLTNTKVSVTNWNFKETRFRSPPFKSSYGRYILRLGFSAKYILSLFTLELMGTQVAIH